MIRKAVVFTLFAFITAVPSLCQGVPSPLIVGHQALGRITWDWRPLFPDWKILFGEWRRGYRYAGLCEHDKRRIDIWIWQYQSPRSVSKVIVHELAHAFDRKFLTPEMRQEWLTVRKIPHARWSRGCDFCNDDASGAGDFAESVSWTLQGPGAIFKSKLGHPPNEGQRALIKKWLREAQQRLTSSGSLFFRSCSPIVYPSTAMNARAPWQKARLL